MRRGRAERRPRRSRARNRRAPVRQFRRNPEGPGPWEALFEEGDKGGKGTNLVLFPVNPTALKMAAKAFSMLRRYKKYRATVTELIEALSPFGDYKSRIKPKGNLNENELGDVLEEVIGYENGRPVLIDESFEEIDPTAARRILRVASKIQFDPRVPYLGDADDYLPIGLHEEWEAIGRGVEGHFPDFGLLSGEGILGATGISEEQFRKAVEDLASTVVQSLSPGSEGAYPIVSVGSTTKEGWPRYSLGLMASGPLESPDGIERISPLGMGTNRGVLADGLVRSILLGKMWNLSSSSWNKGSSLIFALPGPLYNSKEVETTGTFGFAADVCSPTITYTKESSSEKEEVVSLSVVFGPKHRTIRSGRLEIGGSVYGITSGALVEQKRKDVLPHYAFEARGEGVVRGKLSIEREGICELVLSGVSDEAAGLVALRGLDLSKPFAVKRTAATNKCPSPAFQNMLAQAVGRLIDLSATLPFDVLRFLEDCDLSDADRNKIRSMLRGAKGCRDVAATVEKFPPLIQWLTKKGHLGGDIGSIPGVRPHRRECGRSPLMFVGYGPDVPAARRLPEPLVAAVEKAVKDGTFTFTTDNPEYAKQIGLVQAPPEPTGSGPEGRLTTKERQQLRAFRQSWKFRDAFHRWLLIHGLGMYRLTLISRADGKWTYSVLFSEDARGERTALVHPSVTARVLQREFERSKQAQTVINSITSEAVTLASRLLMPLVRTEGGKGAPGISSLPVSFRGSWCLDPRNQMGPVVQCDANVRKQLKDAAALPLEFYLPATSDSGPSWYGDSVFVRNVPALREGVVAARTASATIVPTLLMLTRMGAGHRAVQVGKRAKRDQLSELYESMKGEIQNARYEYTVDRMRGTLVEEGEKAAQELENSLFETRGRTERKDRSVPLVREGAVQSPVEKVVITMYGMLNDDNLGAMKRRNEAMGGTDANPKDPAYRAYLEKSHFYTTLETPSGVTEWYAAQPKKLRLRFKKVHADAILAGNKDEEYRPGDALLEPGELGVVRIQGNDVYLRLKGTRGGVPTYAVSLDGTFRDIPPAPQPPQQAPLIMDSWWSAFVGQSATKNPKAGRGAGFTERFRPWFPEYGVFYQTELTSREIHDILGEYRLWGESQRETQEAQDLGRSKFWAKEDGERLLANAEMTVKKKRLSRGRVALTKMSLQAPGDRKKKGYTFYVRSWGPMGAEDFFTELGAGDPNRGLNLFVERARLPFVDESGNRIQQYSSTRELIDAKAIVPDEYGNPELKSVVTGDLRSWLSGRGKDLVPYDVNFENDFLPLPGGDLVFNPGNALRKYICDQAGLTRHPGSEGGGETLAELWLRKEKGLGDSDIEMLDVGFSVVGTMQVNLGRLESIKRNIARAVSMGPDQGVLLFSMKVPTRRGPGNGPDEEYIDESLFTSPDASMGLRPAPQSQYVVKELIQYLVQAQWSAGRGIVPATGQRANILAFEPVSKTEKFKREQEKIEEAEEEEDSPMPPPLQAMVAYYTTLQGAVDGYYGSRRLPAGVIAARRAYSVYGGDQARAVRTKEGLRSPDPNNLVFGTKKGTGFSNIFSLASQICKATGICVPSGGGQRGLVVGLTRREGRYLDIVPIFWALEDEAEGAGLRASNDIRLERIDRLEVPFYVAEMEGVVDGGVYNVEIGKRFFTMRTYLEDEDTYLLTFEAVEQTLPEDKLYSRMVQAGIELPDQPRDSEQLADAYREEKGKKPTSKQVAQLVAKEQREYARGLKRALEQLKANLTLQYQHTMDLGLLREHLEQRSLGVHSIREDEYASPELRRGYAEDDASADEVWMFAEEYLDDMSKPNPSRYGRRSRKSRRSRRNPMTAQQVQALIAYAQSSGDEDAIRRARRAIEDFRRESDSPAEWEITKAGLDTLFPGQGKLRPDSWSVRSTFAEGLGETGFDMVSRLGRIPPGAEVDLTDEGAVITAADAERMAAMEALPFDRPATRKLLERQAGLSVDEARGILEAQRDAVRRRGPRGRYTMQPSSAVCKLYRKRKLSTYSLPSGLVSAIDRMDGMVNSILIVMSPQRNLEGQSLPIPRVMTWRRGEHIDCDMVGNQANDLSELLGKAIQSSLYWVAEKPQRRQVGRGRTSIYVYRVGNNRLYRIWSPDQPVSLASVTAGLSGEPIADLGRNSGELEKEIQNYLAAESQLGIGNARRGVTFTRAQETVEEEGMAGAFGESTKTIPQTGRRGGRGGLERG